MRFRRWVHSRWVRFALLAMVLIDLAAVFATQGAFPGYKGLPKTLLIDVRGEGRSYYGFFEFRDGLYHRFDPDDGAYDARLKSGDPLLFVVHYYEHPTSHGIISPVVYRTSGSFSILGDTDPTPSQLSELRAALAHYIAIERGDPQRAAHVSDPTWSEGGLLWR